MTPEAAAALINLGVAGVGLYLFVSGSLLARSVVEARIALIIQLYDARIAEGDARYLEMRADRDGWKALALGTERRLDRALPTVATALGVPSAQPAREAGE